MTISNVVTTVTLRDGLQVLANENRQHVLGAFCGTRSQAERRAESLKLAGYGPATLHRSQATGRYYVTITNGPALVKH